MTSKVNFQAEDAARSVMARLCETWERGNGEAYAELFAEDAQYVTAPGERLHGRKRIAESHQQVFDTIFKKTKLGRNYPCTIREIAPEVVLVEAEGSVLFAGEKEQKIVPNGLMTMVLAKREGAWRIVSFQNTPTGRWRMVKFIWRYIVSRFSVGRAGISEQPA